MQITSIIDAAKRHVHGWKFAEPSSIAWVHNVSGGALWYPPVGAQPARIEMAWGQDSDVLWHEIFHSVFRDCPLNHSSRANAWWGEAFCNAFSEANRQIFFKKSLDASDWARATTDDLHWRRYIVPCVLILRYVEFSAENFHNFWWAINVQARNDPSWKLNRLLRYSPETGESYLTTPEDVIP